MAQGRSINLALSNRGRRSLRAIGIEEEILQYAIPMKGRLLHNKNEKTKSVPYDARTKQCIYSVGRNYLNSALLDATSNYANVSLQFNHKLLNADLQNGVAEIKDLISNKMMKIKAKLIVGADGAFSSVRKVMQSTPLFSFSQTYIEHGYMELCIPADRGSAMISNHLHIWPRGSFMMIALPNREGSWTVTLFMPFERFKKIDNPVKLLNFFKSTFPDALSLIGENNLIQDFFKSKPSALLSIKCSPYHYGKAVIIGDAAHAMVPFYGQGMNAGFEDCLILDDLLTQFNGDFNEVIEIFTLRRKDDAHAICDLAMYNYVEMRDLVNRVSYHVRKKIDDMLFYFLPNVWIPLYNSVTFSPMRYKNCIENREWQNKVFRNAMVLTAITLPLVVGCNSYLSN